MKSKRQKLSADVSTNSPPAAPDSGWKTFPESVIPKMFNEGHIYHHLVESLQGGSVEDDSDHNESANAHTLDSHTSKPLRRGDQFFRSGHVTCMRDNRTNKYYYVKAKVLASMKQVLYNVQVTLSVDSGFVVEASCECKSSALGRCSHVGAVLVAINNYLLSFGHDTACTSKPCEWNVGRKTGKNPTKITDVTYESKKSAGGVMQYDGRPQPLRSNNIQKSDLDDFIVSLQNINKNSVSMLQLLLTIEYDDFVLSPEHREVIKCQVDQMLTHMTPSVSGPVKVTSSQGNTTWHNERRVRVTASNAKTIYCCKSEGRFHSLVNEQLWGKPVQTAAMLHGTVSEVLAREAFRSKIDEEIAGFQVADTGMWINRRYPGTGASPDGILFDPISGTKGVLEIKCPISLKGIDPNKFDEILSGKQLGAFCLKRDQTAGVLKLKPNHPYYYQIQLQMAMCEMQWGYFVVWTPCGLHYEKVTYDVKLVDEMLPKLTEFHRRYLCPEYFLMRLPRRLTLMKL